MFLKAECYFVLNCIFFTVVIIKVIIMIVAVL